MNRSVESCGLLKYICVSIIYIKIGGFILSIKYRVQIGQSYLQSVNIKYVSG